MLSSLTTKIALRKVGIKSNTFDFMSPSSKPAKSSPDSSAQHDLDDDEEDAANGGGGGSGGWPAWMSTRKLPLTAQAWLSPAPPPVPVAECPKVGDLAPLDRERQLQFGGGKRVVVLFLRCVGCAFAQKAFLALRNVASRHRGAIQFVAVSHSSPAATKKWLDLIGGTWGNIEVVVDEDRVLYAAWGLGLGTFWSMFNPQTQREAWREKGWLGERVVTSLKRTGSLPTPGAGAGAAAGAAPGKMEGGTAAAEGEWDGPSTVMGNKWQQAGLFGVDGRGTVVYAQKALRADDVMDVDAAIKSLGY